MAMVGFVFDLFFVSITRYPSTPGFYAFSTVIGYIAACWVWHDSKEKKIYFPADLALLWFWIGFPAYLYESKGMKGILIFIGLILSYLLFAYVSITITDSIYYSQFK